MKAKESKQRGKPPSSVVMPKQKRKGELQKEVGSGKNTPKEQHSGITAGNGCYNGYGPNRVEEREVVWIHGFMGR